MKSIGIKRLIISALTGIAMLTFGFYVVPEEAKFLPPLLSFLCAGVSAIRWGVKYEKYDPDADVFGVGFTKRRLPVFVEDRGDINVLALNTYKWFILCIVFGVR